MELKKWWAKKLRLVLKTIKSNYIYNKLKYLKWTF